MVFPLFRSNHSSLSFFCYFVSSPISFLSLFCLITHLISYLRFANRAARFITGYREGLSGAQAAWANRKYHGHRMLPPESILEAKSAINAQYFVFAQLTCACSGKSYISKQIRGRAQIDSQGNVKHGQRFSITMDLARARPSFIPYKSIPHLRDPPLPTYTF